MSRSILLLLILILGLNYCLNTSIQVPVRVIRIYSLASLPRFSEYASTTSYSGVVAPLNLQDFASQGFETDKFNLEKYGLMDIGKRKVNFGGRYILAFGLYGRGAGRVSIFDPETGRVLAPGAVEYRISNWSTKGDLPWVAFRGNSNLIIVHGSLTHLEGINLPEEQVIENYGDHYLLFRDGKFEHLFSVLVESPSRKLKKLIGPCEPYINPLKRTLSWMSHGDRYRLVVRRSQQKLSGSALRFDSSEKYRSIITCVEFEVNGVKWSVPRQLWDTCKDPNLGVWPGNSDFPERKLLSVSTSSGRRQIIVKLYCGYGFERDLHILHLLPNGKSYSESKSIQ